MWRCAALALLATLELGLLVIVQSCGHHIVRSHVQDLAARHVAQQSHMASSTWGLRHSPQDSKVGDRASHGVLLRRAGTVAGGTDGDEPHHHGQGNGHLGHYGPASDASMARTAAAAELWEGGEDVAGPRATGQAANGVYGSAGAQGRDQGHEHADGAKGDDLHRHVEGVSELEEDERTERSSSLQRRSLLQAPVPPPAPIRLSVTYQQLGALDASQQRLLTRVVEAVRRILQKFVNVKRPSSGGLLVDPYCNLNSWACQPDFISRLPNPNRECGLATVLREHIVNPLNCTTPSTRAQREALSRGASPASGVGGGVSAYGTGCTSFAGTRGEDTDMYLYITAVQNDDCQAGAAAWARPCLFDLGNNRPLLGAANVCPRALGLLDEESLTAVLTHEMIHALGFTDSMYNLTRRDDGSLRPLSELVQSTTVGSKRVQLLVSPGVREAARQQFGCPDLQGAQLEEEGSAGSAGSHWEYTHYQGEVMVASTIFAADGSPATLSNLTLAYLDDTGWYVTNRSAAGRLPWGAGAGCELPTMPCADYMTAVPGQRYFCDPSVMAQNGLASAFLCSSTYMSAGMCRKLNFTGGCGLVLSRNVEQTCLGPDAANDMPEVFGWGTGSPSGRCLPVVLRFQASVGYNRYTYPSTARDGDADAACFETVCSADGTKVFVKMLGQQLECPAGQYLNLAHLLPSRYNSGRIGPCPSAQAICSTQSCVKSTCNSVGGSCFNGSCFCNLAFTGASCSFSLITGQAVLDSGSDDDTGSGAAGDSYSPPPPVREWMQIVQLTLALNNSASYVNERIPQLQAAIASWAGLNGSAVFIKRIADGTDSGRITAGDAYDATAIVASTDRRRRRGRGLQQTSPPSSSSSPPPQAAVVTATAKAVATVWLAPGSSQQAAVLLGWLQRNQTQRDLLNSSLAAAGFMVVSGGISYDSFIAQAMDAASPPPGSALTIADAATATADPQNSRGRAVMIIALTVGGVALVGIVGALVTVLVLRSRRSKDRNRRHGRGTAYAVPFAFGNGLGGSGGAGAPPLPYGGGIGGGGGVPAPSFNPFADLRGGAAPVSGQLSASPDTTTAAFSYYSARAAALAPASPSAQRPAHSVSAQSGAPHEGSLPQMAPLYSGPQARLYG